MYYAPWNKQLNSPYVVFVGIDVGVTGGVAVNEVDLKGEAPVDISWNLYKLPVSQYGEKNRKVIDLAIFDNILSFITRRVLEENCIKENCVQVIMEDIPLMGDGKFAIRSMYQMLGELRSMIYTEGYNLITALPNEWTSIVLKNIPVTADKPSLHFVKHRANNKNVYESIPTLKESPRAKKLHHGISDAICLVEYIKHKLLNNYSINKADVR